MRIDVIWASIPVVVDAVAAGAAVGDIAVVLTDDDGVPLLLSFLSLPFIDEDCIVAVVVPLAPPPPPPPPSANDDEITAAL